MCTKEILNFFLFFFFSNYNLKFYYTKSFKCKIRIACDYKIYKQNNYDKYFILKTIAAFLFNIFSLYSCT